MKTAITACASVIAACMLAAFPASAADDNVLQNMHGSVSYTHGSAAETPLAPNASTALDENDDAITGSASLAAVNLADSSQVLVGAQSNVQLRLFAQAAVTRAQFIVVGKVRFIVRHPQGAKADYTFQTPTGQVAVRGTEGDIESSSSGLQVNVYELCDPNAPVSVLVANGGRYTLGAGQSLVAQLVGGVVKAQVQNITQQMIDRFSPDFGVPASWDAAKGEIVSAAQSQTGNAISNATGGYGSQVAGVVGGLFGHKSSSTPTPSPAPASSSCSHSGG
jgi:hypothetical protein